MSEAIRHFLNEPLPEWHQKPLHLTIAEMDDPYLVLEELSQHYHLPQLRFALKEWLDASIKEDEVMSINFVLLYDMMMRVSEAAWVLREKKKTV